MRRIFVAIKIPDKLRSEMERVLAPYRGTSPGISYVKPENFHVTVTFLGNIDESRLKRARLLLRKAGENFRPFVLTLGRARVFGGRILMFEMKSGEFLKLQNMFRTLPGKFSKPHLTLGRISGQILNKEDILNSFASLSGISFNVDSVSIMESKHSKEGRIYTTVYEAKLRGDNVPRSK